MFVVEARLQATEELGLQQTSLVVSRFFTWTAHTWAPPEPEILPVTSVVAFEASVYPVTLSVCIVLVAARPIPTMAQKASARIKSFFIL